MFQTTSQIICCGRIHDLVRSFLSFHPQERPYLVSFGTCTTEPHGDRERPACPRSSSWKTEKLTENTMSFQCVIMDCNDHVSSWMNLNILNEDLAP